MVSGGQGTRAFRRNNFGREPIIRDNQKSESNSSHNKEHKITIVSSL